MGKKVSYETDLPFLGELDRSVDAIKLAAKKIELPENKIFYTLLWFDIKDSFEKESIELLKQGDFEGAINILKNEIFNNCPIIYSADETISNILTNFKIVDNNFYSLKVAPRRLNKNGLYSAMQYYFIHIKQNTGFIDIQEGRSNINLADKYQIACSFRWLKTSEELEASIGLGLNNDSNCKSIFSISNKGVIRYIKSNIELVNNIVKTKFVESNYLLVKRVNDYIEVKLNDNILLKIETKESFNSSFLCFAGEQFVLIENLSFSSLSHNKSLSSGIELNEKTLYYTKNLSIIYLLKLFKRNTIDIELLNYFELIGNYFKQPYFTFHIKSIISPNYICNFSKLTDIFVQEFYLSLYHLVDQNEEYSQLRFYGCFRYLSDDAEKRVKNFTLGSKPYTFENFINPHCSYPSITN